MRSIASTVVLIALIVSGCSKEAPAPTPVYTSVEGNWKFSSASISGSFTIIPCSSCTVNDDKSIAPGGKITLADGTSFVPIGGDVATYNITIAETKDGAGVALTSIQIKITGVNSTFTVMEANRVDVNLISTSVPSSIDESFEITRQ